MAPVVRERGSRRQLGVGEGGGDPRGLEQRLAVGGVAGLALRLADPDQRLTASGAVDVADELDGVTEELHRLGRGETVKRVLSGPAGVIGRLGLVCRRGRKAPVKRKLGQTLVRFSTVELLERLRDAVVHARAARGPEPVIQSLVDERVHEAKLSDPLGRFRQQRGGNGSLQVIQQGTRADVEHRLQELEVEDPADHGREPQDLEGLVAEALHAPLDHLAHALGQREPCGAIDAPAPAGLVEHERP